MPKWLGPSLLYAPTDWEHETRPLGAPHAFQKLEGNTSVSVGIVQKLSQWMQAEHATDMPQLKENDDFQSAGSHPSPHLEQRRLQESMRVLPAAWQHHVQITHELPFADEQQQCADASPLANARAPPWMSHNEAEGERQAAPLAVYHLA